MHFMWILFFADYESGKKRIAALFGLGNDDKEEYYLQLAFRIDLASVHMV